MESKQLFNNCRILINFAETALGRNDFDEYAENMNRLLDLLMKERVGDAPTKQQGDQEQDVKLAPGQQQTFSEDEIKTEIIKKHIERLAKGLKSRSEIIGSAKMFADWIKIELSRALDCKVPEVAGKLADWMGFTLEHEAITATAQEKKTEK